MTIGTETITRGERIGLLRGLAPCRAAFCCCRRCLASINTQGLCAGAGRSRHGGRDLGAVCRDQPPAETREQRAARLATLTDATSLRRDDVVVRSHDRRIGADDDRHGRLLSRRPLRRCCSAAREASSRPACPTTRRSRRRRCRDKTRMLSRWRATIPCPVHMIRAGKDHLTTTTCSNGCRPISSSRAAPTIVQLYPGGDHGFMQRTGAANDARSALRRRRPSPS